VKYAIADPTRFAACVSEIGTERITWICGLAELWAPFFAIVGAPGFTSGLVSVDPARSLRMLHALNVKDYPAAMAEWSQICEFEQLRARNSSELNVSVIKQALAELGLCGPTIRPPLSALGAEDRDAVRRILGDWGLLSSDTND
jgi:4-hydroxy-tetrahydrodipicolinate synthase